MSDISISDISNIKVIKKLYKKNEDKSKIKSGHFSDCHIIKTQLFSAMVSMKIKPNNGSYENYFNESKIYNNNEFSIYSKSYDKYKFKKFYHTALQDYCGFNLRGFEQDICKITKLNLSITLYVCCINRMRMRSNIEDKFNMSENEPKWTHLSWIVNLNGKK